MISCIYQKKAVLSTSSPSPTGRDPSKVQSRLADHTQAFRHFLPSLKAFLLHEPVRRFYASINVS